MQDSVCPEIQSTDEKMSFSLKEIPEAIEKKIYEAAIAAINLVIEKELERFSFEILGNKYKIIKV